MHIVLLGDSILDNKVYVAQTEPDVREQLAGLLSPNDKVTLLAIDGSMIANIPDQVKRIPDDATHLVVSAGGNDLLLELLSLNDATDSVLEVFGRLANISGKFIKAYGAMLDSVIARQLPTTLCTVYNPRFESAAEQLLAVTALRTFNDCIVQEAGRVGVPVIELRQVCDDDKDFANPIEPSA